MFQLFLGREGSGSLDVRGLAGGGGDGRTLQACGYNPLDSVMP